MSESVSFNPETYIDGGLFDGPLTVTSPKFVDDFDYGGKAKPTLACIISFIDENGKTNEQAYSCGDSKKFTPSDDGKKLIAVGNTKQLNKNSNFALFMIELINAGFPSDKFSDDITCIDGLHADFTRKAVTDMVKRTGVGKENATILVPSEIYTLPGDDGDRFEASTKARKGTKAKGTAGKPKGTTKTDTTDDSDVKEAAVEVVSQVLADNEGTIAKKALLGAVLKAAKDNPHKKAIIGMVGKNAFLDDDEAPWEFDGAELTLG